MRKGNVGTGYKVVACLGKFGHDTKASALAVLKRMKRKKDITPYRCWHCDKWHLGSSARTDLLR